jgi:DNA-directed RNA polymerase II subunit RPB2
MGNVTVMMNSQIPILRGMIKEEVTDVINVPAEEIRRYTKVFLNGEWLGLTKKPRKLYKVLKDMKYNSQIDVHTSIIHELKSDIENKELKIYCDGGRMFRPIFRVENNEMLLKKSHVDMISLDEDKSSTMVTSWNEFMAKFPGVIEYIDTDEQYNSMLAMFPIDVTDMKNRQDTSADLIKKTKLDPSQTVVNR